MSSQQRSLTLLELRFQQVVGFDGSLTGEHLRAVPGGDGDCVQRSQEIQDADTQQQPGDPDWNTALVSREGTALGVSVPIVCAGDSVRGHAGHTAEPSGPSIPSALCCEQLAGVQASWGTDRGEQGSSLGCPEEPRDPNGCPVSLEFY